MWCWPCKFWAKKFCCLFLKDMSGRSVSRIANCWWIFLPNWQNWIDPFLCFIFPFRCNCFWEQVFQVWIFHWKKSVKLFVCFRMLFMQNFILENFSHVSNFLYCLLLVHCIGFVVNNHKKTIKKVFPSYSFLSIFVSSYYRKTDIKIVNYEWPNDR